MNKLKILFTLILLISTSQLAAQNQESGRTIFSGGSNTVTFKNSDRSSGGPVVSQDNLKSGIIENSTVNSNWPPGVIIVNIGNGVIIVTGAYPGDYPPPLVVVDGCIVNRREGC